MNRRATLIFAAILIATGCLERERPHLPLAAPLQAALDQYLPRFHWGCVSTALRVMNGIAKLTPSSLGYSGRLVRPIAGFSDTYLGVDVGSYGEPQAWQIVESIAFGTEDSTAARQAMTRLE